MALTGPPYRLLCAEWIEGKSGAFWISDEFRVHEATSGKLLSTLDLSTLSQGR